RFAYQKGFRRIPEFVRRDGGAFGMGFGTAFLPCGLILTFAWVAAATRSPFEGAALFFLLWAGSLPALMVATVVGEKLLQARKGSPALRRGLVLAVLVLGLATLARKGGVAADLAMKQEIPVCHVSR